MIASKKSVLAFYLVLSGALMANPAQFTETVLSSDFNYPYGINVGDLDGDGDTDITVADGINVNSVFWFENDGSGKFVRHLIHHQPPPAWQLLRHTIVDVNRDGFPDIVISELSTGDLRWLENPGPQHIRETWKAHFITLSGRIPSAYDVTAGDIDGDGFPDVVASSLLFDTPLIWWKNPGRRQDRTAGNVPLAFENAWAGGRRNTIAKGLIETNAVRLVDMDGDGDLDLFATSPTRGLILWYENSGKSSAPTWTQHVIDKIGRPNRGQVIDMDGDGDPDVVMASGYGDGPASSEVRPVVPQVAWYENLGKGAAWKKHIVKEPFPFAFEAVAKDMDGDGDMDIVSTAWHRGDGLALAWFENKGNDAWTLHPLKSNWPAALSVVVADFDGDGRPEILANAPGRKTHEVRLWQNKGSGPSDPK